MKVSPSQQGKSLLKPLYYIAHNNSMIIGLYSCIGKTTIGICYFTNMPCTFRHLVPIR